jgi:Tectonin domain
MAIPIAVILEGVYEAIKKLNTKRSVAMLIRNNTDKGFTLAGSNNEHGRFAVDPPNVMPARSKSTGEPGYAAFGAVSNDWSVATGVEGWVKYQSGPLLLQISWDVPFLLKPGEDNSGGAEITGESPTRYRATAHIGSGHDATNEYDVFLSPWWKYHGCGKDIAVGANGAVWLVGCSETAGGFVLRLLDGSGWKPVSSGGVRIAAGPDGTPWLVNDEGKIYRGRMDGSGTWGWGDPLPGCGKDIAIGGDGMVWLVGCSETSGGFVLRRREKGQPDSSPWKVVSGGGVRIAAGPDGTPWLVNNEGKIYRGRMDGSGTWGWGDPLPGCAKDIAVGGNSTVWVVGCDQVSGGWSLHKWTGVDPNHPWERAQGGGTNISVAPDGRPWIVNDIGNIYKRDVP